MVTRPNDLLEDAFETLQNASLYNPRYRNEIRPLVLKLKDLMKMVKIDSLKKRQVTEFFQIL